MDVGAALVADRQASVRSTTRRCRPSRVLSSTPLRAMRSAIPRRRREARQCRTSSPVSACSVAERWRGPPARALDGFHRVEQHREDRAVGAVRPRQPRRERVAPFFAGRLALSTLARDQSIQSASPRRSRRMRWSRCQPPAAPQSRSRQQILPLPQPNSRGRSSHGIPPGSTERIPTAPRDPAHAGSPPSASVAPAATTAGSPPTGRPSPRLCSRLSGVFACVDRVMETKRRGKLFVPLVVLIVAQRGRAHIDRTIGAFRPSRALCWSAAE